MATGKATKAVYESIYFPNRAAWREWLAANHAGSPGITMVYDRKGAGTERLSYEEAVEEALCFGWIDSVGSKIDARRTGLRMTPRKQGSAWSTVNKGRIERLLADGLMHPAGQTKIDAGKRDGSWDIYDQIEHLTPPDDLAAALAADEAAGAGFTAFSPSRRKAILLWVATAKQTATRARRIAVIVADAREGRSPMDWPGPKNRLAGGTDG